jgi:PD-(D/E)XK nuclease superfamily
MIYSYTQISHYLACPRRYRHRYLEGWREKDTRASMLFGRAFEKALGALFLRQDPGAVLFQEWSAHKSDQVEYYGKDTWEHFLWQGIQLLERFVQDDRVRVRQPRRTLQASLRDQSLARMISSPISTLLAN